MGACIINNVEAPSLSSVMFTFVDMQGAQQFMLQTTNINMGVRLGLVNHERSKALIFEVDSKPLKGW